MCTHVVSTFLGGLIESSIRCQELNLCFKLPRDVHVAFFRISGLKAKIMSYWSTFGDAFLHHVALHLMHYTDQFRVLSLKVDMPILTCIFFTFNRLTLTSEMHFVKFHPEVASCLLSRGKRKYAPLGMRLLWKYMRNYFPVYQ